MIQMNSNLYTAAIRKHAMGRAARLLNLAVLLLIPFSAWCDSKRNESDTLYRPPIQSPVAADTGRASVESRTYYVDPLIREDSCANYAATERRCGNGTETAYRDPNHASGVTRPGDSVLLRQAIYSDSFVPRKSGIAGSPISFRGYPGEKVTITLKERSSLPAIVLNDKHHIVIDGLTVDGAGSWAQVWNSTHVVIENATFLNARDRGSRGGFRMVNSDYNRILNSRFEDGNDNLMLENSSRNLVQGNIFRKARHTLLVIACGNYNVIRQNEFHNELQKAGETFDCEGKIESLYDDTRQVRRMDATRRNVWDRNRFIHTRQSEKWYKYNAIQFAGQHGIVRHNVFYDNLGGGVALQVYADEALYNYGNRIYHNTFHNNRCFGIFAGQGPAKKYSDNVIKNNVFFGNQNCLGDTTADIVIHDRWATEITGNYIGNPLFMDSIRLDFRLRPGSPAIDAGKFLTRTIGSGASSKVLKVKDTGYFFDGYGIPGEIGDNIHLEGNDDTAVVLAVDDREHTLLLDRPLSWKDGQGLALEYKGTKPDAGAIESQ